MFDFGLSELVVVFVVALLVLGPTRLPGLVRKVGRWVGKARAMARDFRDQLEAEVNVEELNRSIQRQVMEQPTPPPETTPGPESSMPADAPAADAGTPQDVPADGAQALADSGYPYGVPTNTSSTSADPAVTGEGLQPGDDEYSHAHAPGAEPAPWSPEPEPEAGVAAQDSGKAAGDGTDDPAAATRRDA